MVLRRIVSDLAELRGLPRSALANARLFREVSGFSPADQARLRTHDTTLQDTAALQDLAIRALPWHEGPIELLGQFYEALLAAQRGAGRGLRKLTGSYYTPTRLTRLVVERALDTLLTRADEALCKRAWRVVDPALGAGAFLVQAGRLIAARTGRSLSDVVRRELFGADVSPLAIAVAQVSLWLLADDRGLDPALLEQNLLLGDALCSPEAGRAVGVVGVDWSCIERAGGADLILGNPPWVAFAGRAAQPLPSELRSHYRATYRAFSGYPSLHGLFIERAARLAPRGVVALLVPSPVADLAGYRHVRSALSVGHAVCEPLLELGQDAFESVTQPCFALIAEPRTELAPASDTAWLLTERARAANVASQLAAPLALKRLDSLPRLPPRLFGELGFQTSARVTRELLYRGEHPPPTHDYPLLEGRNIAEFRCGAPRLFLKRDQDVLAACRCRLRPMDSFAHVKIVVRQTAAIPIAALHDGTPFRNSLLAVFEHPDFPAGLLLGLLNSQLYRALHLAARRDARQATFPQVKVAHLRALPAPPRHSSGCERIAALAIDATRRGLDASLRRALDDLVFEEFGIEAGEAEEITEFVRQRSPRAGLMLPP